MSMPVYGYNANSYSAQPYGQYGASGGYTQPYGQNYGNSSQAWPTMQPSAPTNYAMPQNPGWSGPGNNFTPQGYAYPTPTQQNDSFFPNPGNAFPGSRNTGGPADRLPDFSPPAPSSPLTPSLSAEDTLNEVKKSVKDIVEAPLVVSSDKKASLVERAASAVGGGIGGIFRGLSSGYKKAMRSPEKNTPTNPA